MDVVIRPKEETKRIALPPGEKLLTLVLPRKARILSYPAFLLPDPLNPFSFHLRGGTEERLLRGTIVFAWRGKEKHCELILEGEKRNPSFSGFHPVFPEHPLFPKGGSILLAPGDYLLEGKVSLTPPFHLVGASGTVLFREGEVLRIEGEGEGLVQDVTFSLRGRRSGNVAVVLKSRVVFEGCVFRGGIREKLSWMGNGVVAARGASLVFRRCVFLENEAAGILAEEGTTVTVEDSIFVNNRGEGILAKRGSVLVVRRSRFFSNAWGVTCGGLCLFEGNEISENTTGGLCLLRGAEGIFGDNRISRNPVGVVWPRSENILWGAGNVLEENRIPFLEE